MPSHWVMRRWFTPYAVILYHPCGAHTFVPAEQAERKSIGTGGKCAACVQALARRKRAA